MLYAKEYKQPNFFLYASSAMDKNRQKTAVIVYTPPPPED
jgi:hypothetical protein